MALRASIGAGRGRLLQQVLVESSLLTLLASALGVLCAMLAVPLLVGMLTTNENPVYLDAGIDWRVRMFVAALGGFTTVLFGLTPALRASVAMPGEVIALGNERHTAHAGVARSLVARNRVQWLAVSPQFFQTMRTRIIDGRELQPGENDTSAPITVVVNNTFARKYFPARARLAGG